MATTAFKGTPVQISGELPAVGSSAPTIDLVGADMSEVTTDGLAGRRVVLNIFPSVDTGVCATSVRTFNKLAAGLENTTVVCISKDLPFALGRFCGAEGIENVTVTSDFRTGFGDAYGVTFADGPLRGLLSRSVVVIDADGVVRHTEHVAETGQEPDYDAALAALA